MIYLFNAEHVSRATAVKLIKELEDKDIEVEFADVGCIFENELRLIVTGDEEDAKTIRSRIWELNHGLCCDMEIITADQLDTYL